MADTVAQEALLIKGGSIRSKLQFVHETFGSDARKALASELAERGVATVLEASWYDYEHFDFVLRRIAEEHFAGSVERLREVGRYSARLALTTTYEHFLGRRDLAGFLDRISKLHGRYYSRGGLSVHERKGNGCLLRLHGAGFYREPDLHVAAGFYMGAAELLGCEDVRCTFEHYPSEARFLLQWSRKAES